MVARRTILAATAFAAGGLLVLDTTTAAAQPDGNPPGTPTITQIPERSAPDGATVFRSNPAIVNGHPQSVESWHRLPDANALAVNFYSGVPECHGVDAEVQQTADIIAVKLRSGTVPEAVDKACIEIAVSATLTVQLDSPVGDRAVVSIT